MLPAGFVATALGAAILGMVFDSGGLLRLALVAAVGCIVSVVAIPLVVMGRAVRHEGRRPSP
jgi:predicted MFS family arabinose efflux permease